MLDLFDISQFGIAIFTVGVLAYVIKKFLCFMKHQEENFNDIVRNHLNSDMEAKHKLQLSNQELASVIRELLSFLKRSNGK